MIVQTILSWYLCGNIRLRVLWTKQIYLENVRMSVCISADSSSVKPLKRTFFEKIPTKHVFWVKIKWVREILFWKVSKKTYYGPNPPSKISLGLKHFLQIFCAKFYPLRFVMPPIPQKRALLYVLYESNVFANFQH